MDSIHLYGSETVDNASHRMADAGDSMLRAANLFSESCDRLIRAMSEATEKMDHIVERFEVVSSSMGS